MWTAFCRAVLGLGLLWLGSGCSETTPPAAPPKPPPLDQEPIGVQIARAEPGLQGQTFRVLLDFEKTVQLVFVSPAGQLATGIAHTGRSSLPLGSQQRMLDVKVSSLMGEGRFPGGWTLAGAYFRAEQPAHVTVECRDATTGTVLGQRGTVIEPGRWTGAWLDLTRLTGTARSGTLTFTVVAEGPVWCDDVIVVNNQRVLEAPASSAPVDSGWTIRQAGHSIAIDRPGRFRITASTPEASSEGWTCEEANEIRVRLVGATGRQWTIYHDGRHYQDGKADLLYNPSGASARQTFLEQHTQPAQASVGEEFGRLEQSTPGDQHNDGYNEIRGAYQFHAKGPRFEVKLAPRSAPLIRPVLEIGNLPAGRVMAMVEGQLIERIARLANGTVLVEVPITINHPTVVNVTVK